MDELNQFLSSVEARARQVLKQQSRRAQESAVRDRAELTRQSKGKPVGSPSSPTAVAAAAGGVASRDELRVRYTPGGALVVDALPRLPPASPARDGKPAAVANQTPVVVLPALERPRRSPEAARKLLESPLYKALAAAAAAPDALGGTRRALRQADQVAALLRKMGLRDAGVQSPAARPEHAVERRMCHACWASADRATGCERHPRVLPAASAPPLELQGPMSWQSTDLFVKYRSEADREALWAAAARLKEQQRQRNDDADDDKNREAVVLPQVARHPVWAKCETQLELENLRTLAETRRRNLAKTFIFDVDHLWLTNLDHFNAGRDAHSPAESNALRGRRDDAAVRNGYSQIPSVSTARALTHARLETYSEPSQSATAAVLVPDDAPAHRRWRRRRGGREAFHPLSLLVCGYEPAPSDSKDVLDRIAAWLDQVPGVALVGSRPVLWWSYPPDRQAELESAKTGDVVQFTRAVALFARDAARSSSNAVLVSLVLALDAPMLAPPLFAWHAGSKQPPPSPMASVAPPSSPAVPRRAAALVSPEANQLLATRLATRLDALLPCSFVLLNCMATAEDQQRLPGETCGHRREWAELNSDAFRQWLLLDGGKCLPPQQFVPVRDVGVSAATLNAPHVGGRYCWHETQAVDGELVRQRTARDYLYVVLNTRARGGSNDATLLAVAMAHERMLDVRNEGKLAQYLAMLAERRRQEERERELREVERKLAAGRLLLEAKRQEQQRIEAALQVAAARAQDRLDGHAVPSTASEPEAGGTGEDGREWLERVAQSVVEDVRGGWERRVLPKDDGVAFYRSVNDQLPARHRFRWQPPVGWDGEVAAATADDTEAEQQAHADDDSDSDEDAAALEREHAQNTREITAMARELLSDAQFLSLLRDKLGLPSDASAGVFVAPTASDASPEASRRRSDVLTRLGLGSTGVFDEQEAADASKAGLVASRMAKLAIPVRVEPVRRPGEGWKRLARARLPQGFARRVYEPRVHGPRSAFIDQPNHATPVGMLDPVQWSEHDPPELVPELRALFVPRASSDLQEKKAQWAEAERRTKLERPAARSQAAPAELEAEEEPQESSMETKVARAVLCARNNNLEGLEAVLDEGVDVNARDNHGNSLFILACQQGNKRLAKLLMRRHADMNARNLNGNTALHYLVEYKHAALAEYVKAKGADDTLPNAVGLTCYEGLSQEQAAAL